MLLYAIGMRTFIQERVLIPTPLVWTRCGQSPTKKSLLHEAPSEVLSTQHQPTDPLKAIEAEEESIRPSYFLL